MNMLVYVSERESLSVSKIGAHEVVTPGTLYPTPYAPRPTPYALHPKPLTTPYLLRRTSCNQ